MVNIETWGVGVLFFVHLCSLLFLVLGFDFCSTVAIAETRNIIARSNLAACYRYQKYIIAILYISNSELMKVKFTIHERLMSVSGG